MISTALVIFTYLFVCLFVCLFMHLLVYFSHTSLFDYTDILPKLPELELPLFVSNSVRYVDEMKSPRFIKTHLPWELLPRQIREGTKKPKVHHLV
jgi:hypothetical protein